MTTQSSQLKAFNLQQHQEKLLAIEADTYAKFSIRLIKAATDINWANSL